MALLLCLGLSSFAADFTVQVLQLRHRLPNDVIPALRPLLKPNESINGYDSRLIVRASPDTLKQIERVLGEIDNRRRNLRISVRLGQATHNQEKDLGVSGDVRSGNTRIVVTNNSGAGSGTNIGLRGGQGNVRIHSERRVTTHQSGNSQTLTVMDGGRAFLRIGESIPQVQTYLALIGNHPSLVTGVQYYDVTTGFEVEPRLIGERVQLDLSPRMAFRSGQGSQLVEMRELRTTVMVAPGSWTEIGSVVESANSLNRTILSGQTRVRSDLRSFQIKVDPLD